MNLTRKTYTTRNEKTVDFLLGFGGWFVLNIALTGIGYGLILLLATINPDWYYSDAYTSFISLLSFVASCLPFVINIGAILYFALTRYWIALGALAAFAASLLLAICLGTVIGVICFTALSGADFR
ncbi:MAG: hypothetical protein HYR94_05195 [Chloroflexi bacterium]|nr:hypothetical protein [Chloroflexota bacterium]